MSLKSFLIIILALAICCPSVFAFKDETRPDFKKVFDAHRVVGTFVIYDSNKKHFIRYNPKRAKTKFTPASTFKIPNTLIGLETGEISGEDYVFKWNGEQHRLENWNQDLVLRNAFQFSCVPCYQDLARRLGEKRMKQWIRSLGYGNKDISGGIDQFWLGSSIKISPNKQVELLRRLYEERLPFSKQNQQIVKRILMIEEQPNYALYAKTGWSVDNGLSIGWYVGFVEQNDNVYYFATNIEARDAGPTFVPARIEITRTLLSELGLL